MENFFPNLQKVAFRIHNDTHTLEQIHDTLKSYDHHSGHIVCREIDANRVHYQGYYLLKEKDYHLKRFRKWLVKTFSLRGNGSYSLKDVQNPDNYKKYLMKEGQFMSIGFDTQVLLDYQLLSYPKTKKFQTELDDLEIRYLKDEIQEQQYIYEFLKLKSKYKQVINTNYVKQRVIMLMGRKDDEQLLKISKTIYEEIERLRQNYFI